MPNAYGFEEQTVPGGAGVVVTSHADQPSMLSYKQEREGLETEAVSPEETQNRQFVIPFTDQQNRVRYLEAVRDFLNNELALVEAALVQERGY